MKYLPIIFRLGTSVLSFALIYIIPLLFDKTFSNKLLLVFAFFFPIAQVCRLGMDSIIVREFSKYSQKDRRKFISIAMLSTVIIFLLFMPFSYLLLMNYFTKIESSAILLMIFVYNLTISASYSYLSLDEKLLYCIFNNFCFYLFSIFSCGLFYLMHGGEIYTYIGINVVVQFLIFYNIYSHERLSNVLVLINDSFDFIRKNLSSSLIFTTITTIQILSAWISQIMSVGWSGQEYISTFTIYQRTISLPIVFLSLVSAFYMSRFSLWDSSGQYDKIKNKYNIVSVKIFIFSLIYIFLFLFYGIDILKIYYEGHGFTFNNALIISVGILISAICGPSSAYLSMVGLENKLFYSVIFSFLVSLLTSNFAFFYYKDAVFSMCISYVSYQVFFSLMTRVFVWKKIQSYSREIA